MKPITVTFNGSAKRTPRMVTLTATDISGVRNGISGMFYWVVKFTTDEHVGTQFVGIVFEAEKYVSVLDIGQLAGDTPLMENSWRGDYFEKALLEAITVWSALPSDVRYPGSF